jgi:hypothetical protein
MDDEEHFDDIEEEYLDDDDEDFYFDDDYYEDVSHYQYFFGPFEDKLRKTWFNLSSTWTSASDTWGDLVSVRTSLDPIDWQSKKFYEPTPKRVSRPHQLMKNKLAQMTSSRAFHVLLLLNYLKKFIERYRSSSDYKNYAVGWFLGNLYVFIFPGCSFNKSQERDIFKLARDLVFMALDWHGLPPETISLSLIQASSTHDSNIQVDTSTETNSKTKTHHTSSDVQLPIIPKPYVEGMAASFKNPKSAGEGPSCPLPATREVKSASKLVSVSVDSVGLVSSLDSLKIAPTPVSGPFGPERFQVMLPTWWVPDIDVDSDSSA